jgi:hypothetical protein
MRRHALFPVLCLTVLMFVAATGAAQAHASAQGTPRSPELRTLDRKIHTAERRIRTWNHRLDRWYQRITKAAMSVDRLTSRSDDAQPLGLEGLMLGLSTRDLDPHRIQAAHHRLRRVLTSRTARRAQRQLEAWSRALDESQRARERLLRHEGHVALPQEPTPTGPATYESWARAFLALVGAPDCSENLTIIVTWETSESTDAAFNPLATTHDMDGATDFNSVGVKNYRSLDQGLDASRDTLQGGAESYGYAAILGSLQACATAEATAVAINASAWCRGCAGGTYITGLLPIVRADYLGHAARLIPTGV